MDWGREFDGEVGQPCPEAPEGGLVVEGKPGEDGEGEGGLNGELGWIANGHI